MSQTPETRSGGKLKLTQIRSTVGRKPQQKKTIRALGLRHPGDSVVHRDGPEIRGMARAVEHLIEIEELTE